MEISQFEMLVKNIENCRDEYLMGEYRSVFESYTRVGDGKNFFPGQVFLASFFESDFGLGKRLGFWDLSNPKCHGQNLLN
jgi:hypothetical protein